MENAVDVVYKIKSQIEDPDCWTQNALARDRTGRPLSGAHSLGAHSWCVSGAYERVMADEDVPEDVRNEVVRAMMSVGIDVLGNEWGGMSEYNDTHTHEELMSFLDKTVEKLKGV